VDEPGESVQNINLEDADAAGGMLPPMALRRGVFWSKRLRASHGLPSIIGNELRVGRVRVEHRGKPVLGVARQ